MLVCVSVLLFFNSAFIVISRLGGQRESGLRCFIVILSCHISLVKICNYRDFSFKLTHSQRSFSFDMRCFCYLRNKTKKKNEMLTSRILIITEKV